MIVAFMTFHEQCNMLQIVIVVTLMISDCGAQYYDAGRDWIQHPPIDCRPMEEVLHFGGCFRNQFLCHDHDSLSYTLIPPSDMIQTVFLDTACFCDPSCWKFKDCCVDATPVEPTLEDDIRWKCDKLPGSNEHIYVIASCPPEWNDPKDISHCERRVSDDDYSYLLDIPVFSNSTGRAYSNIYCAKCHQDVHLSSFRVVMTCPRGLPSCQHLLRDAHYMFGEHRWLIYARGEYFGEYATFAVAEFQNWDGLVKAYAVRRCRPVVESCPNADHYMENCTSYYASYVKEEGPVYKNIYCALCNNVTLASSVQCFNGTEITNLPQLYPSKPDGLQGCVEILRDIPPPMMFPPYSWLFDFHDTSGTNKVGLKLRCKEGEILDPILGLCIPFVCGKQFIKVDGKCVNPTTNESNDPQNKTVMGKNCHMTPVKKEEITILRENNSIYINKTGLTYESSDFEEYDNDTYLVCHSSDLFVEKFSTTQSHLSQATMAVSLICLAVHIAIHASIAKLRNLPGKNLISLSVSLFLAQLLYLFSFTVVEYPMFCAIVAVVTHFCFLASFFWMNVMAYDISRTFRKSNSRSIASHHNKTFWRYAAYAWLTPLAIVFLALITDYTDVVPDIQPGYGRGICWLSHRNGLLVFFAAPLVFLLLANIIFFLLTAYAIHQTTKITRSVVQRNKDQVRFSLYVKLALIMGLTWVFGYVAAVVEWEPLWYIFIVLNASQGAFIFIAFSLKTKVIKLIVARFQDKPLEVLTGSDYTKQSSSSTKTSTDQIRSSQVASVDNSNCS